MKGIAQAPCGDMKHAPGSRSAPIHNRRSMSSGCSTFQGSSIILHGSVGVRPRDRLSTIHASAHEHVAAAYFHSMGVPIISTRVLHVKAAIAEATDASTSRIAVGGFTVQVDVGASHDMQIIRMETSMQSRLLLHWGLVGGKDYKDGWRLPAERFRPVDTVQYKDRALQTRFQRDGDKQVLEIVLEGDEMSDILNFVFKEEDSNQWHDSNGSNFEIPLKPSEAIFKATMENPAAVTGPLPELPNELCGIWAYIKWEQAGCPSRTQAESDAEYRNGILEMKSMLQQGVTLDELWKVAKGEIPYPEFMSSIGSTDVEETKTLPALPVDLINTRAYMIWIESGRPNGADFAKDARRWLEARLLEGSTVQQLEKEVYGSKQAQDAEDKRVAEAEAARRKADEEKRQALAKAAEDQKKQAVKDSPKVQKEEKVDKETKVKLPELPIDLVNTRAYMMWVESGRPDGADFGPDARIWLMGKLKEGRSISELEAEVFGSKREQDMLDAEVRKENAKRQEAEAKLRKEESKKQPSMKILSDTGSQDLGSAFVYQQQRNPMDFIKPSEVPLLSAEKNQKKESALEPLVQKAAVDETVVYRRVYPMGNMAGLLVVVSQKGEDAPVHIEMTTDAADPVVLHWGVSPAGRRNDWIQPGKDILPEESVRIENGIAAETVFQKCDEDECDVSIGGAKVPLQRVSINLPSSHGLVGLQFVLRSKDSTRWWKDGNDNFKVRIPGSGEPSVSSIEEDFIDNQIGLEIIRSESSSMWTLMHRYNKVADILDGLMNGSYGPGVDAAEAAAHLYVWLRYSANRHITWQRNYNTQPRILSAAQDRLTSTIARAHAATAGESQEWVRLMMGTLGRGGDGQKIRDEILNIMHRNGIKEVKKLHNNTTPDDVGICEAFLAFLRSNGDNGVYWRVLSDHGISRARLEGFDRAIKCEPQDYPHMRGTLIGEFENYLNILKAVHSGTDLLTSAQAAAYATPESAKGYLGYVLANRQGQVVPLVEAAVEARTEIRKACTGNKELIYLDLALEDVIRSAAERAAGAHPRAAIRLVGPLLQNLCLTAGDNEEICFCLAAWLALPHDIRAGLRPSREQALQAAAVVDRIRNALADISDAISGRIEPISLALGKAFGVEEWASELFAEEVVRGGPAFAVSQVLGNIESGLRAAAELSAWQVISPGGATGIVRVEHDLYKIQDDVYDTPTVLVIDRVTGEEEIPEGTVAVLTPDAPDVLSHVSVRARNMNVLFATCHEDGPLMELRNLDGKVIDVKTSAAGDVQWTLSDMSALSGAGHEHHEHHRNNNLKINVPQWIGKYAVGMDEFKDNVVGAKSKNIAGLRGKLPDWINLPPSVTVPFGSFEQALSEPECREVKAKLEAASQRIKDDPPAVLRECREIIMGMTVPEMIKGQLSKEMAAAGMEWPDGQERWEEAFKALKGVWASKFNERAYYSMRKAGLPFMDLRMAVLVMRVIPAQYAFVIHTMNPSTRDKSEIYCELVKGLGETLVSGQFTGKSMAFSANKADLDNPKVLSYPSKSAAMFVRESLIFRSDSNGEDLEGYAGAGLYDSITMDPCRTERVDYTKDRMITDEAYRRNILSQICKVGAAIEEALGSPQDVEGVVDPSGKIFVVQTRPQV